jgi:hypothetical protein
VKSLVEWTVPPVRFSRAGTPGFYLTWVRPSVFVSGLVTNLDARAARRTITNAGAQLDFRLSALSSLDLTLSVGGAVAFTDGSRPRREAMILACKVLCASACCSTSSWPSCRCCCSWCCWCSWTASSWPPERHRQGNRLGHRGRLVCDALYRVLTPLLPLSPDGVQPLRRAAHRRDGQGGVHRLPDSRPPHRLSVDAAQLGFAVGTGFALVENLQYLRVLGNAGVVCGSVRGLGTAMLHGATIAIFAMLAQTAADRQPNRLALAFVPGWLAAVAIHSAFNHVPLPPVAMTGLLMVALPALVLFVFQRSEAATRDWVSAGLDLDLVMLEVFSSQGFSHTRFGRYLSELRDRFPGPVVADMLCLLRVELELSVQAKAAVMVREAGVILPVHDDTRHALAEVQYLRASIGPHRHPGAPAVWRDLAPRRLAPLPAGGAGRQAALTLVLGS